MRTDREPDLTLALHHVAGRHGTPLARDHLVDEGLRLPPPAHIDELIAAGRALEVTPGMRLPGGITNLEIRYTATSLAVPERVRFKFKMDGYDRDWTDPGARRVAYYTKPPHGSYTFRVLAANADGVWSPEAATIAFTVAPHWFETWWAYLLYAQIDHPGVAALFDSGELDGGSVFLVMELLRGLDLGQMIARDGPGSPGQAARLVREAAAALAAGHRRGVIHRDLKPANIFLTGAPDGFVTKVVDFGLATSGHVDVRVTLSGIMVGTPAYMSPEQVQGLPLDSRSDLYSLAIVAYEALTGRRAVESQDVGGILIEVLYKTIPPASSVLPGLAPIDASFASALGKQPADRPDIEAWARDFAAALERLPGGAHRWREVLAPGGPE